MADLGLPEFVQMMESVVAHASPALGKAGVMLSKATVEVSYELVRGAGGEFDIKIVEIGGLQKWSKSQTIKINFSRASVESTKELGQDLRQAVEVLGAAIKAASTNYTLEDAEISLALGVSKEGKVKIFFGAEIGNEVIHTLTVTLKKSK